MTVSAVICREMCVTTGPAGRGAAEYGRGGGWSGTLEQRCRRVRPA